MTSQPAAVSMAEACRQLGVSKTSFRKYLAKGRFPNAFQLENMWRVTQADLDAFRASRRVKAPEQPPPA